MSWLAKLFGFTEEAAEKFAKDYAKATAWGITVDEAWNHTENQAFLNLERTGEGG
ncbi:MAG: hypothetical protein GX262_08830 [Clostridia bacterium]|jgi:hypothetical protein|nr:hypothetical protein [Clostridia bacterium]